MPEVGGSVGAGFEHIKKEIPAQLGGNPLAVWIQQSHDTSVGGAQPIPINIRNALTGYIDQRVLNAARFRVGDNGFANLANVLERSGNASAVTLIDVVIFQNAADAYNNPALWAHELTHVGQYMDWGVRDFAIRYARDYSAVERPAYDMQNRFASWRLSQGGGAVGSPFGVPTMGNGGTPSGTLVVGCGCYGPTPGIAAEPRCSSGVVVASVCGGYCQAGGQPYGWICR